MKTLKFLTVCTVGLFGLASCAEQSQKVELPEGVSQAKVDSVSYAVGTSFGTMLEQSKLDGLNYSIIVDAMKDVIAGNELMISEQEASSVIQQYLAVAEEAYAKKAEQIEKDFLSNNKTQEGVMETASGLQYKIIEAGSDVKPGNTDTVEVHYKGALIDGTEFDSSYDQNETVKFPINGVIPGWSEGIKLIGEGGKAILWIPYNLGYGPRQMSPELPGYSTLVFEVELVKVHKAKK